jgi:hypothetical protein
LTRCFPRAFSSPTHYIAAITHRRRLPHVYPHGERLFLTWCLHGALPPARFAPPGKVSAGQAFVYMDRYLDTARTGPTWLKQAAIAKLIVDSVHRGVELGHYKLFAYVVMSNHVHLPIEPLVNPAKLMQSLKGATARGANRLLARTGDPFW